ncbi:MAG: Rpn family recombination-promoting nuclease/putative transposase [Treponema sp.]|nr:Rpn family recombination-promoting nuclease/putative transposase [Treponema sp.]
MQDYDYDFQDIVPVIGKYLDLRIDWAFKYVFSKKEILLKLLNDILPPTITDLEYLSNEIPVRSEKDKRSTLDVICESPDGKFLVEMQRRHTADIDDRLAYYSASLVHGQVKRKDEIYNVKHVYVLCVASFVRSHPEGTPKDKMLFCYDYRENETYELLENAKTSFYYLELSRMKEPDWEKLQKNPERWCYLFKNMSKFASERDEPRDLHGFEDVLEAARVDSLSPEEMDNYQDMLTAVKNEIRSAHLYDISQAEARGEARGKAEGAREKQIEIALRMVNEFGQSPDMAAEMTGLKVSDFIAE